MSEKRHPWLKAWKDKKFNITTNQPSLLVKEYESKLSNRDRILDAGCGNGRNTSYLASKGCKVDAFDVLDANWINDLPDEIKQRINFHQSNVLTYNYDQNRYDAVIATRLIQYLNTNELDFLLERITSSLVKNGFLLLSFNNKGGIFQKDSIKVPKYVYSIEDINGRLKKFFNTVMISEGAKKNKHVNYSGKIQSYDIYAEDLIAPKAQ